MDGMNTPEIKRYISTKNQEVARKRWKNATAEERSRMGRVMAEARKKKYDALKGIHEKVPVGAQGENVGDRKGIEA